MAEDMKLMDEVESLADCELRDYIRRRAEKIVRNTQGDSWDDPEEWQLDAAELAHAVFRDLRR